MPVDRERRHDDHLEPVPRPERGEGDRRPASLEAERGVGRHQEAGERQAGPDPFHEGVIRCPPQGVVEMLDDRDRQPGRLEPFESFLRIEEQGRRRAAQDLVGMMVERDHGRRRTARGGLGSRGGRGGRRGPGACRRRRRPRRRPAPARDASASMPSTTSIRAVSRSGRAAGRPAPRTPCRVRAGRMPRSRSRRGLHRAP